MLIRDLQVKILLVGDSGVGKSSILTRFVDNTFSDNFFNTIGVDFKTKEINISNKIVRLQIVK